MKLKEPELHCEHEGGCPFPTFTECYGCVFLHTTEHPWTIEDQQRAEAALAWYRFGMKIALKAFEDAGILGKGEK